jgi:putative ABC transport system permease protein
MPADVREAISGDLDEVFQRDCRMHGLRQARLRYWRKALSFSSHFVMERWRDRRRGGVMRVGVTWLDVKLGVRMLVRYPGLSLASAFAIAVVVACGTAAAAFDAVLSGTLPFEDGDRIVAIDNWNALANEPQPRALHDFESWRGALKTVEDVGAYRLIERNIGAADRPPEPARIAEISAAAFRIARVPPLLGRHLLSADEIAGAPAAIVVGYDEWQGRFGADPKIVGRTVLVGSEPFTVVGVMPDGFGFPVNENYWIPFRLNPADYLRGQGPVVYVFGRLAAGVDLATAHAELGVVGQRAAADFPDTHAQLRPRVLPYTRWFFSHMTGTIFVQLAVVLLLVIVGANVAVLVYARTATRRNEIAVRSALGAGRWRIVGQMFVEGFVLSATAAAAGLLVARAVRGQLHMLIVQAPFWVDSSLSSWHVVRNVLVLTLLGAIIVGVVPALQATGRRAQSGLQHAASASRWKVGRTYGALIVVQVALAVAILPVAVATAWTTIHAAMVTPGFASQEFMLAGLEMERDIPGARTDAGSTGRFRVRQGELVTRLRSEPGVADVTFLTGTPGNDPQAVFEVEGRDGVDQAVVGRMGADFEQIGVDLLKPLNIPLLAGRVFNARDLGAPDRPVIVNRTFATRILGGNAVGRRIRQTGNGVSSQQWHQVVGVVGDFPPPPSPSAADAMVYQPVSLGDSPVVIIAVQVRGSEPAGFANRLREIAAGIDRNLQLRRIRTMNELLAQGGIELRLAAIVTGLVTLSVLLLSATGLYAMMAFTVAQRRREIGLRIALGASRLSIVRNIMSRSLGQLAIGIGIGTTLAAVMFSEGEVTGESRFAMLPVIAIVVLIIGLTAAVIPVRRGMQVQPTDALTDE